MNNFSPNMLKTFKECQKKYYFRYVQNISAPQKITPFEKGKKIHALANYYLRNEDISKFEQLLTQDEAILWERLKSNKYFQKTYVNSEYTLSCCIDKFWVGGRLDALVRDNSEYYILDYKTGAIPNNPEFDYQTMIYVLAVSEFFKNNNSITFVYIDLKNDKNHEIHFTSELEQKYKAELNHMCNQIEQTKEFQCNEKACKYCEFKKLCYSAF